MSIGDLRHRITIQKYVATRDSFGGEIQTWQDVAKVWASIEPISGKEYFSSQQVNAEVNTRITIRHLEVITPKMRVVFKDRSFDILSVINIKEKKKELHLMCKENIGEE